MKTIDNWSHRCARLYILKLMTVGMFTVQEF